MGWFPRARRRMFRPRETKEYGPRTDVATPLLQYLVAAPVLALDIVLLLSWVVLAPPVLVWWIGMVVFSLGPPALWFVATGWALVTVCGVTPDDTKTIFGHVLTAVFILAVSVVFVYHVVWDWWEAICYGGFFGIPTPHLTISTGMVVGVLLLLLGAVSTLWKPSRYTFGLQALGILASMASWYFRTPSLYWTKGASTTLSNADLVFYGVWAAVCAGVIVPSKFLLDRMFTEMEDDFPYESAEPPPPETVTQTEYRLIRGSQGRPTPSITPPPVVGTFNGTDNTIVRVDELVEFLYLVQRKGTFSREKLFPYKFECSGRKVTQWNHWVELVFPLEPDVYDRATKEIHPEYQNEDGTLDAENVIAMMSLQGYS